MIADAEDLKDVDTACWYSLEGSMLPLTVSYKATNKTLVMTSPKDAASKVQFNAFHRLHYLQKDVDLNLCDPQSDGYTLDKVPDLTGPTASMLLTSKTEAAKPINMTFALLETGVVNIQWNYNDTTGEMPFSVPLEIVSPDMTLGKGALAEHIVIAAASDAPTTVTVLNSQK